MKKLILFLIIILAMSSNAHAENVTNFWKLSGTTLSPLKSTWSLSVAGGITFGASTMSGHLNMGGFNINNARNVYMDADSNSGFGSTADNVIDLFVNGLSYIKYGVNTMAFQGGAPVISTISNTTLAIVPNGTGKVRIGDAYTTPLSLSTDNDSLLVTKDIEVGDTIFTGGKTMATNRGDAPWITMTTTSASPAGTAHSLPILNNGLLMADFYSEADGTGGLQNRELRVPSLRSYGATQQSMGSDVSISAGLALTLPRDGNFFFVLSSQDFLDYVSTTGWQLGSKITLLFDDRVVISHYKASPPAGFASIYNLKHENDFPSKRFLELTLIDIGLGSPVWLAFPEKSSVNSGTAFPSACDEGDIFFKLDDAEMYVCGSPDNWDFVVSY